MSRVSRVPYHQNVYDLLQIEPGESPEAARMLAEHEARFGPLPASVREWYLVPNVVLLAWGNQANTALRNTIWFEPDEFYLAYPLDQVLAQCAVSTGRAERPVWIMDEHQGVTYWMIELDGSDDPPVWRNDAGNQHRDQCVPDSEPFSAFLGKWFAFLYSAGGWVPPPREAPRGTRPRTAKPYDNGLWLRVPDEPLQPPVIDFLTEQVGEPERTPRAGNVTTYAFRPAGGTIRVTADEPGLTGGLSAWWVHADTPDRLAEFARLLMPWGTLRDTLRADTDPAREVLKRARA